MPDPSTALLALLPLLAPHPQGPPRGDWLLAPPEAEAVVRRTGDELVMENGLIRRTFRIAPNAATVALDDLRTGASLLRAVRPEAIVVLDGERWEVGGLTGQPNHAYLAPGWLDALEAEPASFRYVGHAVGETVERLPWKRVRHCEDRPWPPPGVSLRLDFRLSDAALGAWQRQRVAPSAWGRDALLVEDLSDLEGWRVHASSAHPRCSFENEGKPGELYGPANAAVFAERELPPGTRLVEAAVHAGTDAAKSWGPGLALVWPERTVKLCLRPGGARYGVWDGSREVLCDPPGGRFDPGAVQRLRLRVEETAVHCELAVGDGAWTALHVVPLAAPLGEPRSVRVGKLDRAGGPGDFGDAGPLGRCRVEEVRAYGALDPARLAEHHGVGRGLADVTVSVHYEMYDHVPILSKWVTVTNGGTETVVVDELTSEVLAVVEHESAVEASLVSPPRTLHVETDYAFNGFTVKGASRHTVHWVPDPQYATQVNYRRLTPCLLEVRPPLGPDQDVAPGETFESFRAFELVHDSEDRERRGLALRRMYRTIAPWVTENPIMMHMRDARPERVRAAIDQCAEVGFEMVILSFGSGFDMESEDPAYVAEMKGLADYAHSRGIELGGYSLLSSRRIQPLEDNIVSPETGQPGGTTHGNCPALASGWGQRYFEKLYAFFETTGFDLLEHDGSYPGDVDAAARPPLQKGQDDSQWVQWRIITDFYRWCRGRGVYLNVPDYYYLAGSSKCGMGYRETNWSLPREQQHVHARQNIYDGTWEKTPSMGWMFVPLSQYHGGGAAATMEPLSEHLADYDLHMAIAFGAGVQACYRGPRLYDSPEVKAAVKARVDWFKRHRAILESDVIHGRRADGRDVDWMLHVNPALEECGMIVAFNPLDEPVERTLAVDLYYTGIEDVALVRTGDGERREHRLARDHTIRLPIRLGPRGFGWWILESGD